MFDKVIKFSAPKEFLDTMVDKETYPVPIKLNIPEWYKKISHEMRKPTIKGCIPFLDTLTTGYSLKIPIDLKLIHNVIKDGNKLTGLVSNVEPPYIKSRININTNVPNNHAPFQVTGSPFLHKNLDMTVHKILNPWVIKTPPGYSCLFVPPLNNEDDRFSIIPGIVDTDTYNMEINFPIIVNGDKYPTLETIIKKGTPYVQIIPFKRDGWKMKIISNENTTEKEELSFQTNAMHKYKKIFHGKKSWK